MPITLQSSDHLHIRCISLSGDGVFLALHKPSMRATVYRLMSIIPWRREVIGFSDIANVVARKRERDNGTAVYGVVLRLRRGDDVRFGCSNREEAMQIMQAILTFLGRNKIHATDSDSSADIQSDKDAPPPDGVQLSVISLDLH